MILAVLETDLKKQSKLVKMNYDDYCNETNKALSRKNMGGLNFMYDVKDLENCLKLTWKKHLKKENIKVHVHGIILFSYLLH